MKLAIMQPYLFPYLGYFQLIKHVDNFIIYDDVNYINKGWINRNRILVNGKTHTITVPLVGASQNKLIKDICIQQDKKWRAKLLKTIRFNYRNAPHYNTVILKLEDILHFDDHSLSGFIHNSLLILCKYLGIETDLSPTSTIFENSHLKGADRILDICLKTGANNYINPIGGKELYDKEKFRAKGIDVAFIQMGEVAYNQFNNEFVPGLSIIDILMFNSPATITELLKKFDLT